MYSHISAIPILAIIEFKSLFGIRCIPYLQRFTDPLFLEVSHVLNFEKKRMSDRYWFSTYYYCDWQVGVSSRIHFAI